jgi:hypothetical protein
MVYYYIYHNSGHYPFSCLLFKTQLSCIGLSVPQKKHSTSHLRINRLVLSRGLQQWYINTNIRILDISHRSVFDLNLKLTETGFCLRIQMASTWLDPSLCLGRQNPVSKTHVLNKRLDDG